MSYSDPREVNPYAPPEVELDGGSVDWEPFEGFLGFAGFWRRLFAFVIDYFAYLILLRIGVFAVDLLEVLTQTLELPREILGFVALTMLLSSPIFYYAGLESSRLQATLGKCAMGIKVTNLQGGPISFLRACLRLLGKLLSVVILYLGFLMIAFTARKQGLHDFLANTLVVRSR